jgi:hypothetical protein
MNYRNELEALRFKCFQELQVNRKPHKQILREATGNLSKEERIYIEMFD